MEAKKIEKRGKKEFVDIIFKNFIAKLKNNKICYLFL